MQVAPSATPPGGAILICLTEDSRAKKRGVIRLDSTVSDSQPEKTPDHPPVSVEACPCGNPVQAQCDHAIVTGRGKQQQVTVCGAPLCLSCATKRWIHGFRGALVARHYCSAHTPTGELT